MAQKARKYRAAVKPCPGSRITAQDLKGILEAQRFRCALSGVALNQDTLSLDHIIPTSRGGSDELDNLQFVHHAINRMKGSLTDEELVDWCRKIVRAAKAKARRRRK